MAVDEVEMMSQAELVDVVQIDPSWETLLTTPDDVPYWQCPQDLDYADGQRPGDTGRRCKALVSADVKLNEIMSQPETLRVHRRKLTGLCNRTWYSVVPRSAASRWNA